MPCFVSVNKIWTLFQLAVFKDNPDLVKHLHELGCNINARDQTGNTALHIAAVKKHQVKLLTFADKSSYDANRRLIGLFFFFFSGANANA